MSHLHDFLRIEAVELSKQFQKASLMGRGTPETVATHREQHLRQFLERYFPFPSAVAKGNVVAADGTKSASIDCVVLSPSHPRLFEATGERSVLLAEAVDFAIELKPDLSAKSELVRGLDQGISIKKLHRHRYGVIEKENVEYLHKIPFILFGDTGPAKTETLLFNCLEHYEQKEIGYEHQFDMIVVNNRFLVLNVSPNGYYNQSQLRGWMVAETREDTLGLFLSLLLGYPRSEMTIGENPLSYYLQFNWSKWRHLEDIEQRLSALN